MKVLAYICLGVVVISLITGIILTILEKKGKFVSPSPENNSFRSMNSDNTLPSSSEEFSESSKPFIISVIPDSSLSVVASGSITSSPNVVSSIIPEMDEEII